MTISPRAASSSDRRAFLKQSTAALVAGSLAASAAPAVHAAGSDVIRYALIGCGGRGMGAALNAAHADPQNRLTVLADAFPDRIEHARNVLSKQLGDQYGVDGEHCFTDFDCYEKVMQTDVDVVLLCTPPGFRPAQLRAAIDAGKHVFCEKPVAVDGPGVRSVLESTELARNKGLNIVSGLCWRYDFGVRATMERLLDGMIGDIVAIQENYLTGLLWHRGRNESWSDMEYQVRNWLYYTWLSGDHIVEQHIHSLDKAMWLMRDQPPVRCFGLGGRQMRTDPEWGHIYGHFAVCYEWASGARCFSYTRQMDGCSNDVEDYVLGSKGQAQVLAHKIQVGGMNAWSYDGPRPSMYDVEHKELFAAVRAGAPINNGVYMSQSTLMAIMGREACYTGKRITWDEALNSQTRLGPEKLEWGPVPEPPVAQPGITAGP